MANVGTGTGIGIGIGEALGTIGDSLRAKQERERAEREKQAETFEQQMKDISGKLIGKLNGRTLTQALSQPSDDHAEIASIYNDLAQTVSKHNALYPPHETPALIARINKFMGKATAPPRQDPRASMTAQSVMSETPEVASPTGEYGEIIRAMKDASNPNLSEEQRKAAKDFVSKRTETPAKPAWTNYISKDGQIRRVDQNDATDVKAATDAGFQPYVAGARGPKEGTLGAYIAKKYPEGATPEQEIEAKKEWSNTVPKTHVKVGSFEDYLAKKYPNATPDQIIQARKEYQAAAASSSTTTREIVHDNGDGTATVYELTSTTSKGGGAAPSTPSAPSTSQGPNAPKSTPGDLKDQIGRLRPGETIKGKKTAAQNKAETSYAESVKTAVQADTAANFKSSVQDKLLIESLVKAASGRYSQASYENIVGKTGLGNKLEQLYNNVLKGGILPDDVRKQAVDAAHALRDAAKAEMDALEPNTEVESLIKDLKGLKK